jgi:hypothetical protein
MAYSIGRYSITAMASSSVAAGFGLGSIRPARRIRSGVPSRETLLGQGLRNGGCIRRARIRLGKIAAVESLRRASPRQSCFGTEGWTVLSSLAAVTSRIRLATLATSVGYRNPAHLAKIAADVI